MKRFLPFLIIFAFTLWYTYPLWGFSDQMFAIHPTGDNIRSMHFYDFMGTQIQTQLLEDRDVKDFFQFDKPFSPKIRDYFPALLEVYLMAPLVWIFDWPQHWSVILTTYILIGAFGTMYLCRTLGGNNTSLVLCGILVVVLRPIWTDIANGRINAITIGFSFWALGLMLRYLQENNLGTKIILYGLTLCFGYIALCVYPPYPLLLFPFGAIYCCTKFRRELGSKIIACLWVFVPLFLCTYGELFQIHQSNTGILQCENSGCVSYRHVIRFQDLFLTNTLSYIYGGMSVVLWLGIFVGFFRKYRYIWVFSFVLISYFLLSGGNCPTYDEISLTKHLSFLEPLWCISLNIHDFRRFATVASLMLIVLLGLFYSKLSEKTVMNRFLLVFWIWIPYQVYARQLEFLHPSYWHPLNTDDPVLDVISDKGVVAIFPYDLHHQFVTVQQKKDIRLLNPYESPIQKRNPFDNWLHEIGYGRLEPYSVNSEDMERSKVVQIIFDRKRCDYAITEQSCNERFQEILRENLGPPSEYQGIWIWDLLKK